MGGNPSPQMTETPLPKQLSELFQLYCRRIVARKAGRMLEMRNDRMERRSLMVRRAEITQVIIGFFVQPLCQRGSDPGLADAGLARNQHDLAFSLLCALPSARQKFELLAPPDERLGEDARSASNRLATAVGQSTCQ